MAVVTLRLRFIRRSVVTELGKQYDGKGHMFRYFLIAAVGAVGLADTASAQGSEPTTGYIHVGLARVDQADDATLFAGGDPVPDAGFRTEKNVAPAIEAGIFVMPNLAVAGGIVLPVETPNIATGSLDGLGNLGDEEVGFLTATAQYHFARGGLISPYVGAGLAYMYVTDTDDGVVTDLEIEDAAGFALQAGADLRLSKAITLYADVKRLFIDTDASGLLGGAPITAEAEVDPWILQAGVGFRF